MPAGNGKGKGRDWWRLEISMVTGTVVSPEFELSELELELSGWTWAECWERSKAKASWQSPAGTLEMFTFSMQFRAATRSGI
jgi:hypothetical protein